MFFFWKIKTINDFFQKEVIFIISFMISLFVCLLLFVLSSSLHKTRNHECRRKSMTMLVLSYQIIPLIFTVYTNGHDYLALLCSIFVKTKAIVKIFFLKVYSLFFLEFISNFHTSLLGSYQWYGLTNRNYLAIVCHIMLESSAYQIMSFKIILSDKN